MPNMSEILKKLRKEKGLTQAQLAERLNLSQATVASWEVGKRRPDIEFMPTLAQFYGVSVDELYGQEPNIDESMYEAWTIRERLRSEPAFRLFDAALADGLIRYNPARNPAARPHKGQIGGHRAITQQEREWIDTLCLDHRCRPAVMAMLYEGLRPPEAKAFNIDDSVDGDMIHVIAFAHKAKRQHYAITSKGKTEKASREIPLFSPFREAIKGKSGPLIPTARGGELTVQAWRVCWQSYVHQMEREINGMDKRWYGRTREHKAILASGGTLPPWIPFTVRPYDLRHSFCTACRDAGVEINTCIKWMGHADAKMILKVYDEVSPDRIKNEAEKLEKSFSRMQNGMQIKKFHVKRSKIKGCRK